MLQKTQKNGILKTENNLKQYRKSFNLSQSELAKKLGVSRQTISLIERNLLNPNIIFCLKAANLFKVKVEDIFSAERRDETC